MKAATAVAIQNNNKNPNYWEEQYSGIDKIGLT